MPVRRSDVVLTQHDWFPVDSHIKIVHKSRLVIIFLW